METAFYSIHDYYISHHGVKGQKWGIRRWQNLDGTLTEEGKKRYEVAKDRWSNKGVVKRQNRAIASAAGSLGTYAAGAALAIKLTNPTIFGASFAASMALALAYPVYDAIRSSRDNRMATLAKDEVLRKRIEDIRSDETGTRAWEIRREERWKKKLDKARNKADATAPKYKTWKNPGKTAEEVARRRQQIQQQMMLQQQQQQMMLQQQQQQMTLQQQQMLQDNLQQQQLIQQQIDNQNAMRMVGMM